MASKVQAISVKSEQKDFGCQCGRLYQSYAAVYTHIRNKHKRDPVFIKNIKRPVLESHKKGRPKQISKGFLSPEI